MAARAQPRVFRGSVDGRGRRVAVVAGRFNEYVTKHLVEGCLDALEAHGVSRDRVDLVWVPGAFEIPTAARRLAKRGDVDAIIALGCVIRGETPHFDHVCRETARGIGEVGRRTGVPAIFGVLTVDTLEQAIERAGTKLGNKGREAAEAAIEMANLVRSL
ncbi:MAG TPA: 6,7-dimethyl-8-ribityllumazine synthase [Planctomycetota bacterium]|nr:6,7-dimethyl-8-ribityllumazine synthase [Planctomycetota bacterium]